jgi:hypothetical protein
MSSTTGPSRPEPVRSSRFLVHTAAAAAASSLALTPVSDVAGLALLVAGWLLAARGRGADAVALLVVIVPYSGVYLGPAPLTSVYITSCAYLLVLRSVRLREVPGQPLRAALALLLLGVVTCGLLAFPPRTVEGSFVGAETLVILAAVAFVAAIPRHSFPSGRRTVEAALVGLALAGGVSALLNARDAGVEFASSRQLESLIGGSNYAAVLVATAGVLVVGLWRERVLSGAVAVLLSGFFVYVPVALGSRTASAVMLMLCFLVLVGRKAPRLPLFWTAAIAGTVAVAAWQASDLIRMRIDDHSLSTSFAERRLLWSRTADLAADHWFLGAGAGRVADELRSTAETWYPHNFVLSWIAQFGLPLGLVLILVVVPLAALRLRTSATTAYVALVACSLLEPALDTHRLGLVAVALSVVAVHSAAPPPPPEARSPHRTGSMNRVRW